MKNLAAYLILAALTLSISACSSNTPAASTSPVSPTAVASLTANAPTEPPATPTPTPEPLALRVNGQGIPQAVYEEELKRLQDTTPTSTPEEQRQKVLDNLVDQALLAQAAEKSGFTIDDATLQTHLSQLIEKTGGDATFTEWQTRNHYTAESFSAALRESLLAAHQRDEIINSVPESIEQIQARQILVFSEEIANQIYQKLQSGADFATLAKQYDSITGGELSWFPKGYLTQPEVETAAFSIQPGEYTPVVKSSIGYHIVQVISREEHPLTPDARLTLQHSALSSWLEEQRKQSTIETLLP